MATKTKTATEVVGLNQPPMANGAPQETSLRATIEKLQIDADKYQQEAKRFEAMFLKSLGAIEVLHQLEQQQIK